MTVRHLFDREDCYIITVDRTEGGRPSWQSRSVSLHTPDAEGRIEWSILGHGFGYGIRFGRNGSESDVGLDVHVGRLLSLWLRLKTPWTGWARIPQHRDGEKVDGWYLARHTGFRVGNVGWVEVEWDNPEHGHGSRRWTLNRTSLWGRVRYERVEGDSGETVVPMPEGNYDATWTEQITTRRYVRWPGTWRDRLTGPRTSRYVKLDIPGCIPVEGKGENSWDCGMDGICGTSGATVEEAVGNAVKGALRGRSRYGGPDDLPHPMTIGEAESRMSA